MPIKGSSSYFIWLEKFKLNKRKQHCDTLEIKDLYRYGYGIRAIAKLLGHSPSTIQGVIDGLDIKDKTRIKTESKVDSLLLTYLYINKGFGIRKIMKIVGLGYSVLQRRLTRMGIKDTKRISLSSGFSTFYKRRGKGFIASIKKKRFLEEKGICEFCHNRIGDGLNWRDCGNRRSGHLDLKYNIDVTYHHKKPISLGGTGELGNCMVLHKSCHKGNFNLLHEGVYNPLLRNYRGLALGVSNAF